MNRRGNWILARITTDQGVSGIGDASHGGGDERQLKLLQQFFSLVKGRSVFDVEWLRKQVQPEIARAGRHAAVALSALEQCLWDIRGKLFGVECKRVDTPRLTPSIRIALDDLGLTRVAVVYPGSKRFALSDRVEAVPLTALAEPGRLFAA